MTATVVAGTAMVLPVMARHGVNAEGRALLSLVLGVALCASGIVALVVSTRRQARAEGERWTRARGSLAIVRPAAAVAAAMASQASDWGASAAWASGPLPSFKTRGGDPELRLREEVRYEAAALLSAMEQEIDEEGMLICPPRPETARGCPARARMAKGPSPAGARRRRRVVPRSRRRSALLS